MLLLKRALGIVFCQVFSDFFSSRRVLSSNQTLQRLPIYSIEKRAELVWLKQG